MSTVIYPKRLSLITSRVCCVCHTESDSVRPAPVRGSPMLGWAVCASAQCRGILARSQTVTMVPIEDLRRELGENVVVRRSSGEFDHAWRLDGDGYQLDGDQEMLVPVRSKCRTMCKLVTLRDLRDWTQL